MSGITYRDSGVNIDEMNSAVSHIKELVKTTFTPAVLADIGGFGGLYQFDKDAYDEPVLVASTDGVGTKLKIAFATGRHNTVGADLVSHCVNDILVQGAKPMFFLDYISTGQLKAGIVESVVEGLARGCREARCALIGGETAEMPGLYSEGEYDLAGTIVGVVDKSKVILGKTVEKGDVIIGLGSSGLHTNGYSLARKVFFDVLGLTVDDYVVELGATVGEELLKPHRCYERSLRPGIDKGLIKSMAHITGGGFIDNIPRTLPDGMQAVIDKDSFEILPVFSYLAEKGSISEQEMYRTFNMGIGMVVVVAPESVDELVCQISEAGDKAYVIGSIEEGDKKVVLK